MTQLLALEVDRTIALNGTMFKNLFFGLLLAVSPFEFALPDTLDNSKLQGLGDTRYHELLSKSLERPLHIYVRYPESAQDKPDRTYPTLYLLDGGVTYPLLTAYYHYLRFTEEVPELMLVGISYGSDTFEGGNYRSSDFTAPSDEREWWGGAPGFQQVLAEELLPLIERTYPSDPGRRIILGQSLGGQFVLYSALTRPELFWGHIASNPALHRNLDFFLEWHGAEPMPLDATRLYVSEGEFNDAQFKIPAGQWAEYWGAPGRERPFFLKVQAIPGHSHVSAITESFRQGMGWLMSGQP